jgi:blue copper oxidase
MWPQQEDRLSRRGFLRLAAAGAAAAAGVSIPAVSSCDGSTTGPDPLQPFRSPLPTPPTLSVAEATLIAAPGVTSIAGESTDAWLFNGLLPGPSLRARRGDQARIRLLNQLPEPTIVHWHGLMVPAVADGHPRFAVEPGGVFEYEFPIVQRAGAFWYHPHAHHHTAGQIHRGLAGFFIVTDDEEDSLHLPSGSREILLLLQDRDGEPNLAFDYAPTLADLHTGMLRDMPFGNGVRLPSLTVSGARYRFRVLNASQARVYRLALADGGSLAVIGNDGGLLPAVAEVDSIYLGIGERVDFLVDFARYPIGSRLMLKSLPFAVPYAPESGSRQGTELDLLQLVRAEDGNRGDPPLPAILSSPPALGGPAAERTFVLESTDQGDMHQINGRSFDLERVDERIPMGQVERWVFRNESALPHPVHLHGTHFHVESRIGGRNTVFPYEAGWKDTVLVMPPETVAVLVVFDRYPGIFPLHCHNLQHEDQGMMLNVEVV